ncbi:MAG: PIN domain nuclease, partial [Thermodesulfobacteriota bacterium]
VVTKKIKEPFSPEAALEIIETLNPLSAVEMDHMLVVKAINIHMQYNISYRDGLILTAAERAGCSILLSEDLKEGEIYNGIRVQNPF